MSIVYHRYINWSNYLFYNLLVFCVEANKNSRSDWFYLHEAIERFYTYDTHKVSIKPIFMGTKTKYHAKDVEREVAQYTKDKKNPTHVFYCIDLDDWDRKPEDKRLNDEIFSYCKAKGADIIWFCKDIEDVFLGKQVLKDDKKNRAVDFKKKHEIDIVSKEQLSCTEYIRHKSNFLCVLDDYLERKKLV